MPRNSRTQPNVRNFDSLGAGSKKNRAWCGQNADRIHARSAPCPRLKSHRQRPRADYSAQRAGPDDRAWRRASRAKGPADNKLCATKAEEISRRMSDLSKNGACSYAFFRALIAASERAEICFRISREVASGRSSVSFRSPAADKNNLIALDSKL